MLISTCHELKQLMLRCEQMADGEKWVVDLSPEMMTQAKQVQEYCAQNTPFGNFRIFVGNNQLTIYCQKRLQAS